MNFYISVAFIASFGLFMVTVVLNAAHLADPLVDAVLTETAVSQ